jgi:hypothetical protein
MNTFHRPPFTTHDPRITSHGAPTTHLAASQRTFIRRLDLPTLSHRAEKQRRQAVAGDCADDSDVTAFSSADLEAFDDS